MMQRSSQFGSNQSDKTQSRSLSCNSKRESNIDGLLDQSESLLNQIPHDRGTFDTFDFTKYQPEAVSVPRLINKEVLNNTVVLNLSSSCSSNEDCEDTISITSEEDKSVVPGFSFQRLNRRKKFILISVCIANCLSFICLSLLAPFFPAEATSKNVNYSISGWIFGVFSLTQVILSPISGKMLPKIGIKFMYVVGLCLAGGCSILFGISTHIDTTDGPQLFIIVCVLLRVVLAMGCTSINTSCFTLVIEAFPDHIVRVIGFVEVFVGIGYMSGPAIGGVLYGLGGFVLPFAVIGGLLLLFVPMSFYLLPSDTSTTADNNYERKSSLCRLLQSFSVIITCLTIVIVAAIWSVLDPTLEPHLRDLELKPGTVGLLFLLMAALYTISSPVWGYIANQLPDSRILSISGLIISTFGLLILGPSPLIGFPDGYNVLWLNIVAICVLGLFGSAAIFPTFDSFMSIAKKRDFEDDMKTYSMVAGLWGSMYALGEFIGPTICGWLLDVVGFQWTCTYVAGSCAFVLVCISLNWIVETYLNKGKRFTKVFNKIDVETIPNGRVDKTILNGRVDINPDSGIEQIPLLHDSWNGNITMDEESDLMVSYPSLSDSDSV